MKEQIGWCDPGHKKYCPLGCKKGPHGKRFKDYVVPVFADDETEKAPTLLQARIWNRILTNQQRMMFAMCDLGKLDVEARATLAEASKRTGEILCKIGATG